MAHHFPARRGRLAVIGGGVIGLSCALAAARDGWAVTLWDPDPGHGTSWVAGGMLAPLSEGWPGDERACEWGLASLDMWPEFAARLCPEIGDPALAAAKAGLMTGGTVLLGADEADAGHLRVVAEFIGARGREATELSSRQLRGLEPSLGMRAAFALRVPGELAVDNRRVLAALRAACRAAGVASIHSAVGAAKAGALGEGSYEQIVIAAGLGSAAVLDALEVPGEPGIYPAKGEILRLRHRRGTLPPPRGTVRARVHGRDVYLVPRPDGVVVGATQSEAADTVVSAGGVRTLLADAELVMPALSEYELASAEAGVRPMTFDHRPIIARADHRTLIAAGHGRNGMLLAPLTAAKIVAGLAGEALPSLAGVGQGAVREAVQ